MADYRELGPLCGLIEQARDHKEGERPLLVAVDGRSGSGKTTLAANLAACLRRRGLLVEVFQLEDLYQGWRGLGQAALVWQQLAEAIMSGRASSPASAPHWCGWDWATSEPTGPHPFTAAWQAAGGVLIAEGVGALTGAHDLGVFVELDSVRRRQRALARDGQAYRPYWELWAAQEEELLQAHARTYAGVDVCYRQK